MVKNIYKGSDIVVRTLYEDKEEDLEMELHQIFALSLFLFIVLMNV